MATAGKTITCRAAVAWEPKKPLGIETVEVAPPKAGEVRFKVVANGACHSDLWIMEGKCWDDRMQWPMILGHEGAGIVESVGEGVTDFKPGDHVIPLFQPNCQTCQFCKREDTNLCDTNRDSQARGEMPDGTTRFTCRGKPVYHFLGCSTFSEYTVVPVASLSKIDPAAPLDKVCLIGCGISTGFGAAVNTARVEEGSVCAVWGLGAIGLATLMGCRAAKAKRIIAVDINPMKFEVAKKFGATECVNPKDYNKPIEEVIKELTNGGCEYTFECVGSTATMNAAFNSCRVGPSVATVVGLVAVGEKVAVSPLPFLFGRVWKGTFFGGCKGKESVPKMVTMYMNKQLMVDEFISHTFTLDGVNEAFDLMRAGKSIRSVVKLQ